jgi:integrase
VTDVVRTAGAPLRRNRFSARAAALPGSDSSGGVLTVATLESVRRLQEQASAPSTRRGYTTDWVAFTLWCGLHGLAPLPAAPMTVAAYLAESAQLLGLDGEQFYAVGTLRRWLASINKAHFTAGFAKPGAFPDVVQTMEGISRTNARPEAKKDPLLLFDLTHILSSIDLSSWPAGVIGHRNFLLLLVGFGGAFRRSELASLQLEDIRLHREDGLHIRLRKSKTDQKGAGITKAIPFGANPLTCTPCAFVRWLNVFAASQVGRPETIRVLQAADTTRHLCRGAAPALSDTMMASPLFRPVMKNGAIKDREISGDVVNYVVKHLAAGAGISGLDLGAHSLRAGFVTQAFRQGATHHEVMRQTRHTDIATVEGYSRDNDPLAHNAVTRIGL